MVAGADAAAPRNPAPAPTPAPAPAAAAVAEAASEAAPKTPVAATTANAETDVAAGRDPAKVAAEMEAKKRTFKHEIVRLVKKEAKPFLESGQIASKEEFKQLCRKLTHKVIEKERDNVEISEATPRKVARYVKTHFEKRAKYYEREREGEQDQDAQDQDQDQDADEE